MLMNIKKRYIPIVAIAFILMLLTYPFIYLFHWLLVRRGREAV